MLRAVQDPEGHTAETVTALVLEYLTAARVQSAQVMALANPAAPALELAQDRSSPHAEDVMAGGRFVSAVIELRFELLRALGEGRTLDICFEAAASTHSVGNACGVMGDWTLMREIFEEGKNGTSYVATMSAPGTRLQ